MNQKELLHRKERKKVRRKYRLKNMTELENLTKEEKHLEKLISGREALGEFLLPLVETSRQREIENSITEE